MKYKNPQVSINLRPVQIEGVSRVVCIFCGFTTCVEFDLDLHLYEFHRMDLVKLPIGKGSLDFRIEYAIQEGRRIGQSLNVTNNESKQRLGYLIG